MAVYRGRKDKPRCVEVCAVGCVGEMLDATLKGLNDAGWNVRQIFQEGPAFYRVFGQREHDETP